VILSVLLVTVLGLSLAAQQQPPPATVVAANVDTSESDLTPMDPKEIVAAVTGPAPAESGPTNPVPLTPEARERTQGIWWYLLVIGILLLGRTRCSQTGCRKHRDSHYSCKVR